MNMSKSRDIQAKMPSPKVIYASNESKSVLARNLEECRDNDKNSQSVFLSFKCIWLVTVKVLNSYIITYKSQLFTVLGNGMTSRMFINPFPVRYMRFSTNIRISSNLCLWMKLSWMSLKIRKIFPWLWI